MKLWLNWRCLLGQHHFKVMQPANEDPYVICLNCARQWSVDPFLDLRPGAVNVWKPRKEKPGN